MIQFFHVTKLYPGGQTALDEVTFDIDSGQFVFLTGASGAGKTTLLRMIFREEVPSSGQILVNGRNVSSIPRSKIPYLRRTIGVVFQDFRLIARKTIFENVTYLPRLLGVDLQEQKKQAYQALRRVGLAHRLNAFRRALGRRAAAGGDRPRADQRSGHPDRRRAHGQPRSGALQGDPAALPGGQSAGDHGDPRHPRPRHIQRVGRRVLTLDGGRLVLDQELAGTDPPVLDPLAAMSVPDDSYEPPQEPPPPDPSGGDSAVSFLQALRYFFREATINLLRGWKVSLLAILTIAVSLFIGGAFLLVSGNLSASVERWRGEMRVVIYLKPETPEADSRRLAAEAARAPGVTSVEPVTAAAARQRFQEVFPSLSKLVAGWQEEPRPAS